MDPDPTAPTGVGAVITLSRLLKHFSRQLVIGTLRVKVLQLMSSSRVKIYLVQKLHPDPTSY